MSDGVTNSDNCHLRINHVLATSPASLRSADRAANQRTIWDWGEFAMVSRSGKSIDQVVAHDPRSSSCGCPGCAGLSEREVLSRVETLGPEAVEFLPPRLDDQPGT